MTPYAIYEHAQQYWLTQRYPAALAYSVAVSVVEGGTPKVEHYATSYDAVKNVVIVDPVSDYEVQHPVKPTGVDIKLLNFRLNKPLAPIDFIGVPRLRPNYTFGMAPFVPAPPAPTPTPFDSMAVVDDVRRELHDPNPRATPSPKPTPDNEPRVITTVIANDRPYLITLLGDENVDGHNCFHLGLKPTRNPGKYRLREAWIDEQSFAPWKLVLASNFVWGAATHVGWTIYYGDLDGAHYITREIASAPIAHAGELYSNVVLSFESLRATDTPRPWLNYHVGEPLDEPESPAVTQ